MAALESALENRKGEVRFLFLYCESATFGDLFFYCESATFDGAVFLLPKVHFGADWVGLIDFGVRWTCVVRRRRPRNS